MKHVRLYEVQITNRESNNGHHINEWPDHRWSRKVESWQEAIPASGDRGQNRFSGIGPRSRFIVSCPTSGEVWECDLKDVRVGVAFKFGEWAYSQSGQKLPSSFWEVS